MTRARMWERVSGDQQDERNQTRDLESWCESHGYDYDPSETYRAHAKSAYKGEHAKLLHQALEDMRRGDYEVLVVWRSDRIDREEKLGEHIAKANRNGGRIEFVKDAELNDLTGLTGRVMTVIKSYGNWEYSHKIGESVGISFDRIKANNGVAGRVRYGYRLTGPKYNRVPVMVPDEARIVREASRRYLAGETIDAICDDFNAREIPSPTWKGQPGKHWYAKTLAGLLRSPSIAGRRVDSNGKTVATYEPIITWQDHTRLVKRLDSRAHRKGISPGNVALLTSTLFDDMGHPMYRLGPAYYCRKCHARVSLEVMNARVNAVFLRSTQWHKVQRLIPGANHDDEIARLRLDRSELDDLADDYDERHAELTAEIRRLASLPAEPDRFEWVDTDETEGQVWARMTDAERRDMLIGAGFKFTVTDETHWTVTVPEGWLGIEM